MRKPLILLGCCALFAGAGTVQASAQSTTPAPPAMVTPDQPHAGSGGAANAQKGEPLSSQLAQSNGTLHPPPVDPGMQKTPTQPGTMPVIRPPGTAGGAPGPVAK